jgi:RNA polymerase sigma factor (sigma-70 family)
MEHTIEQLRRLVKQDPETDQELLDAYRTRRDQAAFAQLVQRHGAMVLGVCRRILGEHALAEDAFQAAFLVLARRADALAIRGPIGGWLHGVAYRTALKARTTMHRRRIRERPMDPLPQREAAPTAANDWRDILDEELDALPAPQRQVLVFCDIEGRSLKEASVQLNVPPSTLSNRLAAARKKLAARLTRRGVTLSVPTLTAVLAHETLAAVPSCLAHHAVQAAVGGGIVSASAALLAQGVMQAMFLTKLKTVCGTAVAIGMLTLGILWQAQAGGGQDGAQDGARVPQAVAGRQETTRESLTAKSALLAAVQAAKETEAIDDGQLRDKVNLLVSIAIQQERSGDQPGAGATFKEAITVTKKIMNDEARAEAQAHVGFYQAHAGLVEDATATAESITIKEGKLKGAKLQHRLDQLQGPIHGEIASRLAKDGKYAEALAAAERVPVRVLRIKDKDKVIERRDAARRDFAYTNIAEAQIKAGKGAEALRTIRKIESRPGTIYLLADAVRVHGKGADRDKVRQLIADFKTDVDKAHVSQQTRYYVLADVQAALGDAAGAMAWIAKLQAPEDRAMALSGLSVGLTRTHPKDAR